MVFIQGLMALTFMSFSPWAHLQMLVVIFRTASGAKCGSQCYILSCHQILIKWERRDLASEICFLVLKSCKENCHWFSWKSSSRPAGPVMASSVSAWPFKATLELWGGYLHLRSSADMGSAVYWRNSLHFAGFFHMPKHGGRRGRPKQNPGFLLFQLFLVLSNACCDHCLRLREFDF